MPCGYDGTPNNFTQYIYTSITSTSGYIYIIPYSILTNDYTIYHGFGYFITNGGYYPSPYGKKINNGIMWYNALYNDKTASTRADY